MSTSAQGDLHAGHAKRLLHQADHGDDELDHDNARLATIAKAQIHATLAVYYQMTVVR